MLAATLGYIAKRIQNEAVERRLAILELLMRHQAEVLRMVLGAGRLLAAGGCLPVADL